MRLRSLGLLGVVWTGMWPGWVHSADPQVHVVAVGDVAFRRQVGKAVAVGELDPFAQVKSTLVDADVTFGNLETVLTVRPLPEPKTSRSYPIIPSPPQGARLLAEVGFDVVSVANNHVFDFFAPGFFDTLAHLAKAKVATIGGGATPQQAFTPYIVEVNGVRLGFLAFASGVNRAPHGVAYVAKRWGDAPLRAIRALRLQVDVVLVSVHFGVEGEPKPGPKQTHFAHAVIDAGADVLIGHHPHVLQSVEIYRERPIVYSLGNFLFGKQSKVRRQSAILHLRLGSGKQPIRSVSFQPVLADPEREIPLLAEGEEARLIRERLRNVSRGFAASWTEHGEELELLGPWTMPAVSAR